MIDRQVLRLLFALTGALTCIKLVLGRGKSLDVLLLIYGLHGVSYSKVRPRLHGVTVFPRLIT